MHVTKGAPPVSPYAPDDREHKSERSVEREARHMSDRPGPLIYRGLTRGNHEHNRIRR